MQTTRVEEAAGNPPEAALSRPAAAVGNHLAEVARRPEEAGPIHRVEAEVAPHPAEADFRSMAEAGYRWGVEADFHPEAVAEDFLQEADYSAGEAVNLLRPVVVAEEEVAAAGEVVAEEAAVPEPDPSYRRPLTQPPLPQSGQMHPGQTTSGRQLPSMTIPDPIQRSHRG